MKKNKITILLCFISLLLTAQHVNAMASGKEKQNEPAKAGKDTLLTSETVSGLKFRSIGPAFASGRIADIAVNPKNHSEWYIGVASGNIWKTVNNGTTFEPVFENYGAYSIGCVAIDPGNSNVIWAGTGEGNHQRSLGFGDGVYKSCDGGKSWKNMGLRESRQIGQILIDPQNSEVVYVAAEGSVWGPGGDRGLYKTLDGGKKWKKILSISENTGVNNIIMDPRNPRVLYASSEQRRRHVFTKIGGGPETAVYKSTDAGESWEKLTSGLPTGDMGGMGLAISPVNPDIVYAIVEASEDAGGFYRSTDRGASWQKMSSHYAQGQYYNKIFCDPCDPDKVYSMETISHYTEDGGKTWTPLGNNKRHVDDHAFWIDPADTRHFLIGSDGGIYETFDGGKEFLFKSNLPVTQFYRVQVDNSLPFYYVYGGTQDNNSFGGPSRNTSVSGVLSDEWMVTNGGDGFWSQIDPTDPNIVYAESQYGGMVRFDKKSQEYVDIRPEPGKGENSFRWNWDTPLLLSPHSPTRLYCAAERVFRSDDRGQTWRAISDDLTTQTDRNKWPVMGKFWSIDAVQKDVSTSLFGTIISLDESTVKEDLLYAGTDDGLIQVSENAGKSWKKISTFPGVPEYTYVSDIFSSPLDENTVFASFDNTLRDDFKPYILKSTDKGQSWKSISGNLPLRGAVHTVIQDHINPQLLFAGTEFGCFFSIDGGESWIQLKAGLPTISIKDMVVQKRENDLVLASFGRGFFILDDITPLRTVSKELLEKNGFLFPVKDALMFIQSDGKDSQGSTEYAAKNPDFGAIFTYYLKEVPKTLKEIRSEKESELFKKGVPIPQPTEKDLRDEKNEIPPYLTFTIRDATGQVVRTLKKAAARGINRINWDLRYQSMNSLESGETYDPLRDNGSGILAMPGKYTVEMILTSGPVQKTIGSRVEFEATVLNNTSLPAKDRTEQVAFTLKAAKLARVTQGTELYSMHLLRRVNDLRVAANNSSVTSPEVSLRLRELQLKMDEIINVKFNRRTNKPSQEENPPAPVPLNTRLDKLTASIWSYSGAPTMGQQDAYTILEQELPEVYDQVKLIGEKDLPEIEKILEQASAPVTPGRLPEWKK